MKSSTAAILSNSLYFQKQAQDASAPSGSSPAPKSGSGYGSIVIGALAGGGLGLINHLLTPKDEDENSTLRLLRHVLGGAALGSLAGYGLDYFNVPAKVESTVKAIAGNADATPATGRRWETYPEEIDKWAKNNPALARALTGGIVGIGTGEGLQASRRAYLRHLASRELTTPARNLANPFSELPFSDAIQHLKTTPKSVEYLKEIGSPYANTLFAALRKRDMSQVQAVLDHLGDQGLFTKVVNSTTGEAHVPLSNIAQAKRHIQTANAAVKLFNQNNASGFWGKQWNAAKGHALPLGLGLVGAGIGVATAKPMPQQARFGN